MEIPGRVILSHGNGALPRLEINTDWSNAEIYLHGAHVTYFQKKNEPSLLFLNPASQFKEGTPIRGGIPIIFPWFGAREGEAMPHGFARLQTWELRETVQLPSGEIRVRLILPDASAAAAFPKFSAEYTVTIGRTLTAELTVTNLSSGNFTFENCLHTYFAAGDISAVTVTGLQGVGYLDKTENFARKTEQAEHIKFTQETDRVYFDTTSTTEIHDTNLHRRIRIEKSGSLSTVVWNPWAEKAEQIPDFAGGKFRQMVCVESGNVGDNRITLAAGKVAVLKVEISTLAL